jgi:hypothetical protein
MILVIHHGDQDFITCYSKTCKGSAVLCLLETISDNTDSEFSNSTD